MSWHPIKYQKGLKKMAINILVVDDSAVMRTMVIKTMRMSGLPLGEIYEAANGQQGLEALHGNWIDLVLLDINMPVMNGEQMIDHMLGDPELRDIPTIVISTESSRTRIERLQQKGARFIHKPFTPEMIRDTVVEILAIGVGDDRTD